MVTQSWCEKCDTGQANSYPNYDSITHCYHHFRAHTPISTSSNHSLFLMRDWKGQAAVAVKFLDQSKHTTSWCET